MKKLLKGVRITDSEAFIKHNILERITGDLLIEYDEIHGHHILFSSNGVVVYEAFLGVGFIKLFRDQGITVIYNTTTGKSIAFMDFSHEVWTELNEIYSAFNEELKLRQEEIKEVVNNLVNKLVSETWIYNLCYNFLNQVDNRLFLEESLLRGFEEILKFKDILGEKCLITGGKNESLINVNDRFYEEIYENFERFVKIVSSKIDFSTPTEARYVCWKLLYLVAIDYFADVFEQQYGKFFSNIQLSLDIFVDKYLDANIIGNCKKNIMMFVCYLTRRKFFKTNNIYNNYYELSEIISQKTEERKLKELEIRISKPINKAFEKKSITIDDIDLMSGKEFEEFIGEIFRKMGFTVTFTKSTGDQGVDIIAEKNGLRLGIQAKRYSRSVPNSAIQEIVAGLNLYKLDRGIVVTNSYFTESAVELALANNIILWDREILKEKLDNFYRD